MNYIKAFAHTNVRKTRCLIGKDNFGISNVSYGINDIMRTGIPAVFNKRNSCTAQSRPYTPRRTIMYVPGHDAKKLKKIPSFAVDCAILECEDGVAVNMKVQARQNIREALDYLHIDSFDLALRINSRSSGLMEADLGAIIGDDLGAKADVTKLPRTILLPKVDTVDDIANFTDRLQSVKLGREYRPFLLIYVESALSLINLTDVLKKASQFSKDGVYQLDGVIFGSDDFIADIGAERTSDASEVMYARQKIVTLAKAYFLQAIDMVYIDIPDLEGLRKECEVGARLGYTGKQVIHPSHLPVVQAAFTPSTARVEWATKLVSSFDEHQRNGKGAFTFHGQMIDMPLVLQAKNVLRIVKNVKKQS